MTGLSIIAMMWIWYYHVHKNNEGNTYLIRMLHFIDIIKNNSVNNLEHLFNEIISKQYETNYFDWKKNINGFIIFIFEHMVYLKI